MKPILIRTNDTKSANEIVKQFKKYMKQRSGINSVASINVLQKSPFNAFQMYDKLVFMSDYFILSNINPIDLFKGQNPFYKNIDVSDRLILCTVIDQDTESIFPKGFRTINIDPLIKLGYVKQQLIDDYSYIAYLSACIQLLNDNYKNFSFEEKRFIEDIFSEKINRTGRKIHSIVSGYRKKTQVLQSAI